LLLASELGHTDIINTLLNYGATTTQVNKLGNTAYSVAKNEGHEKAADILNEFEKGELGLLKQFLE
jgi:ankyrin repeat protein